METCTLTSIFGSDQIFCLFVELIIVLRRFRISRESAYYLRNPSVCLSVSIYQRRSHWTDFREIS
jgi:ribosomal protein L19